MTGPDFLSAAYAEDPYAHYATMRAHHPLYVHPATGYHVVSRHVDVVRALKGPPFTNECYAWQAEPVMGGRTIVQMDGAEHAGYRRLLGTPLRGPDHHERVVPEIARISTQLIDGFRRDGRVDLMDRYARWLPINLMAALLDLPERDRPRFQGWYHALIAFMSNLAADPDVAAAGLAARADMTAFLRPLIARRRAAPGDDVLSALCTARFDGRPLTEEQIQAHCSTLVSAGGDTTVSGIANTVAQLLLHPEHLDAVRDDPGLVDRMHIEAIRLRPPAHLILRYAAEDVELSGGVVPAGATVACMIGAANRDPDRFTRPDAFDPYRAELDPAQAFTPGGATVTFGRGRHFCLGANLARTTVAVAIGQLLRELPDLRLADGAELREVGFVTRRLAALDLAFTPAAGTDGTDLA
ncbi:cytochrome P450 [Actinomadura hibisca]|uniref:cytochrome P450 n=1 Tax=Actinomadura hibisca TaxID=68565 RepID=UPI0008369628|nr:cytochrome P450 [Actinomadura hibisca]